MNFGDRVFRPLQTLQRNTALGLRFWDLAAGTSAVDGLRVELFAAGRPHQRCRLLPNGSGIYAAHRVPGLAAFELDTGDASDAIDAPWQAATTSPPRLYRVEVRDPLQRFIAFAFDVALPVRGLPLWPDPWLQQVLADDAAPASPALADRLPLFSAPSRPPPPPLAAVYAQLQEDGSRRVPAYSLLAASVDGRRCGLGMADADGRVAVLFPYPEPPRQPLASPPEARADFRWTVTLQAWGAPSFASPGTAPAPGGDGALPDLAHLLAQFASPWQVLGAASQRLEYRVPLVARSAPGDVLRLSV